MAKGVYKYFTTWRRVTPKVDPSPSPSSRTFEAFTPTGRRARTPPLRLSPGRRPAEAIPLGVPITVLGVIALASLATAVVLRAYTPRETWVFDRPAAQQPSLQAKHTLY